MSKKYTKKMTNVHYDEHDYNITVEAINSPDVPHVIMQVIRRAITQANFDLETKRREISDNLVLCNCAQHSLDRQNYTAAAWTCPVHGYQTC
jgi:hypothetical protein